MTHSRSILFPLFLAFALLFAQQAGAAHALHHALEDAVQHDKDALHSGACEQCADYAQLGNALSTGIFEFILPQAFAGTLPHSASAFRSAQLLAAIARAPPASPAA